MEKILNREDFTTAIEGIQRAGTDLKLGLFKDYLKNNPAQEILKSTYLAKIGAFVRSWKSWAETLQDQIKNTKPVEGINAIKFNEVKEYLYSSVDYASILPFTDGIFRGIKKFEIENAKDIEDYRKFTINKAFKGRADTVGGLVEEVTSLQPDYDTSAVSNMAEVKLFDSIKHQKLFNPNDAHQVFQSIEKSIEFIFYSHHDGLVNFPNDHMLVVSIINNIIEYATYTLTAYASRIYAVAAYANPYIVSRKAYQEAVDEFSVKTEGLCNIMLETEEGVARDFRNPDNFFNRLKDFLIMTCDDDFSDQKYNYGGNIGTSWKMFLDENNPNIFSQKLIGNPLRSYIQHYLPFGYLNFDMSDPGGYKSISDKLQEFVHNDKFAYANTSTPKDELIIAIARSTPEKETIESYKEFTRDMIKFYGGLLSQISGLMRDYTNMGYESDYAAVRARNESSRSQIRDILVSLYKDIAVALLYRARELEKELNVFKMKQKASTEILFSLNPYGSKERAHILNGSMATVVPVTARIPIETIDYYKVPYNDELSMYDEAAKLLLGENDPYFTEDADGNVLSKIWNAIMSWFAAIGRNIGKFIDDKTIDAAIEWVKKNEDTLASLEIKSKIKIKKYRKDFNINFNPIKNAIQNGFNSNNFDTKEKANAFVESMYKSMPSGNELVNLFLKKETNLDSARQIYLRYLLFEDATVSPNASLEFPTKEIAVMKEVQYYMELWIDTVKKGKEVATKIREELKNFQELLEKCKKDSTAWTEAVMYTEDGEADGQTNMLDTTNNVDAPPSVTTTSTSNEDKDKDKDKEKKNELKGNINAAIVGIQMVQVNILQTHYKAFMMMFKDYYNYIKAVYYESKKESKEKESEEKK